jgi:IS30 family transposase
VVEAKREARWSPEQIAHGLRRAYPDDPSMRVSHETIYLSLFVQGRGALRRELTQQLRTHRRSRGARGGSGAAPAPAPARGADRSSTRCRSASARPRRRTAPYPGTGRATSCTGTGRRPWAPVVRPVERTSRHLLLFRLPAGYKGGPTREALAAAIRRLPEQLRRSHTCVRWNHGKEMSEQVRFTADTGVQVYFCDPRSPWA